MLKTITLLGVAFSFVSFSHLAHAQHTGEPARIGMLRSSVPPADQMAAFRQGMRERGHIEGKTYILIGSWRKPGEKKVQNSVLAKRLVAKRVDLIVAVGSRMTRAAERIAPSTPIVMAASSNPVGGGLVKSLASPGGNITGVTSGALEVHAKAIEILKQLKPEIRRVAALHRKARPGSFEKVDNRTANALNIEIIGYGILETDDYDTSFKRLAESGIDAISFRSTPSFSTSQRKRMVEAALRAKLATVSSSREMTELGGLMSMGPDRLWLFRRAAAYVDLILRGAKAGDLPVERPPSFELAINMKTARALGINVPQLLLLRANEVIQ